MPGTRVIVDGYQAKDGSRRANGRDLTLPSGSKLFMGSSGTGAPRDGATMIRTFWTVGMPAARPAAAMLFLFTFVGAWNNFFWPFIVLDRQNPTLPVALSLLQSNYFVDYSIVLAGVVLATIPLLLLFVFAGRQLVSGIMAGAVKG